MLLMREAGLIVNYNGQVICQPVPVAARLLKLSFRNPPGHGGLSVVSVLCCLVEVSATS